MRYPNIPNQFSSCVQCGHGHGSESSCVRASESRTSGTGSSMRSHAGASAFTPCSGPCSRHVIFVAHSTGLLPSCRFRFEQELNKGANSWQAAWRLQCRSSPWVFCLSPSGTTAHQRGRGVLYSLVYDAGANCGLEPGRRGHVASIRLRALGATSIELSTARPCPPLHLHVRHRQRNSFLWQQRGLRHTD